MKKFHFILIILIALLLGCLIWYWYAQQLNKLDEKIKNEEFSIGYNAAQGRIEDMYEAGIIDPAKVTRSGLQNAASIAGMILTTECIVVDQKEEE